MEYNQTGNIILQKEKRKFFIEYWKHRILYALRIPHNIPRGPLDGQKYEKQDIAKFVATFSFVMKVSQISEIDTGKISSWRGKTQGIYEKDLKSGDLV